MGVKTANLAIVFTDIENFTHRTSNQTLEQNKLLLQKHDSLLSPIFKAFGGRIIKSIGDSFLVAFESPTQAVLSGVAIQDKVWAHNRTVSETEQFNVRVAVNVGEVRLDSDDIFGEPVNIASRLEGITESGAVYFTEAVYLVMDKVEVPSVEVGKFEFKGIPDKLRIYKVPKGPHRVSAATKSEDDLLDNDAPYGNLGLRRMPEDLMKRSLAITAELGSKAMEFGTDLHSKASVLKSELGSKTQDVRSQMLKRVMDAVGKFKSKFSLSRRAKISAGVAAFIFLVGIVKILRH